MRSEWEELALKDVLEEIIDYRGKTPAKMGGDWSKTGYRVLSARHVKTGNIVREEEIRTVNQDVYDKWMQIEIEPGDIILTSEAPFGEAFYWDKDEKIVLGQRLYGLRANPSIIESRFLYYAITGYYFQKQLSARATGTTVRGLRQPELLKCTVSVPPLPTQRSIADTLSCLDAKIENNNKIIANLEQQAQAIFKSWFIDFEPFQEGEFVDSELGMIPEGWKAGTIADLGKVVGGSTPSKKFTEYFSENGIAWITPKDLSINKNKFVAKGQIDITQLGLKNSSAKVMPKGTVLFSSRAPIGYVAIAKNEVTTNQGFKSVVPREDVGTEYVYHFLRNNVSTIEAVAGGSTFKEVSGATMKQIPALVPSKSVLEEFKKVIHLHFQLQELLEKQNTTLATLRDTLLPKLMSGEIEVPIDQ